MPALLTSISRPPYVAFRKSRILSILPPSVMSSWWNLGFLGRPSLESSSTAFCPNSSFLAKIITKAFWKLLHSFQIESNQLISLILLSASFSYISGPMRSNKPKENPANGYLSILHKLLDTDTSELPNIPTCTKHYIHINIIFWVLRSTSIDS